MHVYMAHLIAIYPVCLKLLITQASVSCDASIEFAFCSRFYNAMVCQHCLTPFGKVNEFSRS